MTGALYQNSKNPSFPIEVTKRHEVRQGGRRVRAFRQFILSTSNVKFSLYRGWGIVTFGTLYSSRNNYFTKLVVSVYLHLRYIENTPAR